MGEEFNSFKRLSNLIQFIIRTGDSRFSELNRELRKTMPAESIWNSALINYRDAVGVHYEFHDSLMEVAGLIHECERDIEGWKSVDREGQLAFQELLDTVKAAIFEVNGRSWEEFREKFNDPFLTALRIAAHDMSHYQSEEEIEEGTLQDLQIEIEEIIEKVLQSNLESGLKDLLLDDLEAIRQAIFRYRRSGAEGIRVAVDRNLGSMFRHREEFKQVLDEEDQIVLTSYLNFIAKVDRFASLAKKVIPIAERGYETLQRMLSSGV